MFVESILKNQWIPSIYVMLNPQLLMMVHHVIILLWAHRQYHGLDGKTAISPLKLGLLPSFCRIVSSVIFGGAVGSRNKNGTFFFFFKIRWKNTEIAQEILIIVKQPVFQRFFVVVCPLRIPKGFQHQTTIISSPHRILHGKVTNQRGGGWFLV